MENGGWKAAAPYMPLHNFHTSGQAGCGEAAFRLPVIKDYVILKRGKHNVTVSIATQSRPAYYRVMISAHHPAWVILLSDHAQFHGFAVVDGDEHGTGIGPLDSHTLQIEKLAFGKNFLEIGH